MAIRQVKYWKCDLCGNPFPRSSLRKYSRKQLRKITKTIMGKEEDWIRPEYSKIENLIAFKRKSRLCRECAP